MREIPESPRIAALLFRRVGDSLLATPALRAVRSRFPRAHLSVICEPQVERVFYGNAALSEVIVVSASPSVPRMVSALRTHGRPDVVLDFLSNPRTAIATALSFAPRRIGFACPGRRWAYSDTVALQNPATPIYSALHKSRLAEAAGCVSDGWHSEYFLAESDVRFAEEQWQRRGWRDTDEIIAFFIHSRREYKRWPLERFADVIRRLTDESQSVPLVLSTPGDELAVESLQTHGSVSESNILRTANLGQLGAVLKRCRLLIGNDGGPKHIAIALDVPTLTIFGREPTAYWTPPESSRHRVVSAISSGVSTSALWPSAEDVFNILRQMRCTANFR
ncbi:MAG: glycosyltransferase family 9 protein [bacterium]|nr:glycosyltransferase family 9 protein [bacterium]